MSYSLRPEPHELREARNTLEGALESCKYTLEKEEGLRVNLGASSDEHYGAHGLATDSGSAQIYFNPDIENWEEELKKTAINSYGTAWFYENIEEVDFVWEEFLASTLGLVFLEELGEGREIEKETLEDEWREKEGKLESQLSVEVQEDFSWQLKLAVGRKLLEENELEDFPDLKLSDVRQAGEEVFS
ncbi:MAG: hypothetical protein ABEK04_04410 [Candidatus Nanohalobium sp.]